jgi:hypothetical protein
MRLFLTITLTAIIVASISSCEKPVNCKEGLVTYSKVVIHTASFFNFNNESLVTLSGMNKDVKLTPSDATEGVIYTTGDVNLNGYKLTLNNVTLVVRGNLNGGGTVVTNGAKGSICVNGNTQNNPDMSRATVGCNTLSDDEVDSFVEVGTDCDLNSVKYIGDVRFRATEFQSL